MHMKHMGALALACLALSSCSFAIHFNSSSSSSTSSQSSAPVSSQTSGSGEESGKTKIAQVYSDYAENNIYPIDSAPTIGACRMLVIPVWFTDSTNYVDSSKRENVRADILTAYFGSAQATGWHSVKSFYETESGGKVSIGGTVSEWYEVGHPMSYYSDKTEGADAVASLSITAKNWYFFNHALDSPKYYDGDGDGYIDAVMLIYAAPDYMTLGRSDYGNLWAYCYWAQKTSERRTSQPGTNAFFWASYDFLYSSSKAYMRAGTSYGAGDTTFCNIDAHTYIHEMGHIFGLDDYYDYGPNAYSPAGSFSMQDFNVGGHDPYSMMAMGWADPYIPTESTSITIGAFQSTHDLILLTPSWNQFNSPFDEYLLLELYTPTGLNAFDCSHAYGGNYPTGANAVGIRLWHVDARLLYVEYDGDAHANQMTSDTKCRSYYGVTHAFSNSYGDEDYGSPLGSSYDRYNLLQLVRNNTSVSMLTKSKLENSDLFRNGSSFRMSSYSKQFVKGTSLNNGQSLGWSFSVSIDGYGENAKATIDLVRE